MMHSTLKIKSPNTSEEFEQIYQLNYNTFVEEIPQHDQRIDRRLVDRYEGQSSYRIAVFGEEVVGMVCYSFERPFSLEMKRVNLDRVIQSADKAVEIRLLAVKSGNRNTMVIYRLLEDLYRILVSKQATIAVISGTNRELSFYRKIGFIPFGHSVGTEAATYQPMKIRIETLNKIFRDD